MISKYYSIKSVDLGSMAILIDVVKNMGYASVSLSVGFLYYNIL